MIVALLFTAYEVVVILWAIKQMRDIVYPAGDDVKSTEPTLPTTEIFRNVYIGKM